MVAATKVEMVVTPPKPVLRDYAATDRDRLLAHFSVTWSATHEPEFVKWSLCNAAAPPDPVNRMSGDDGRMIVADLHGDIIGSAGYRSADQVSYIMGMYIHPDWQRQGLGAEMLVEALRHLPVDRNVLVYAMASSTWAVAFYEKQGFKRFEQSDPEFGNGHFPCIGLFLHHSRLVCIDGGR